MFLQEKINITLRCTKWFLAYKRHELILSLSVVLSGSSRSAFHLAHTRTKNTQKKENPKKTKKEEKKPPQNQNKNKTHN